METPYVGRKNGLKIKTFHAVDGCRTEQVHSAAWLVISRKTMVPPEAREIMVPPSAEIMD